MNNHPLHRFIALVQFDQHLHDLLRTQEQLEQDNLSINNALLSDEQLSVARKKEAIEARKTVDAIELDIKTLDQKDKKIQKQLQQAVNYKESQIFQREIDLLRQQQYELEESLMKAWHRLESAERAAAEQKKAYEVKKDLAHELIEKNEQKKAQLQKDIVVYTQQREDKLTDIPEEWLEKYAMMKRQISDPVIAVDGDSCGVCFHELAAQELMRLKNGAVLECKGCFRFLYNKNVLSDVRSS